MNNTKKIDGSNLYVCSDGTVWSEFGGKLKKLNPETTRLGYVRVTTSSIGGKRRRKLLHVLVAEAFIHKPKEEHRTCDDPLARLRSRGREGIEKS